MKLKSSVVTSVMIACLLLWGTTLHAQGLYSNNSLSSDNKVGVTPSTPGGVFRDPPPDDNIDGPSDPPGDSPIGEGVVILSLLSGAYAFVKRNNSKKHED